MIRKFGSKEAFERVKKAHALIERGREAGLTAEAGFTQEQLDQRVQSCTLNSHRLVLFVEQRFGTAASEALYDQLNQRHFLAAGVLNDGALLRACIASIGLDAGQRAECEAFLADPARGRAQTLHLFESTQSAAFGIDSIPTLVVDGQYQLSGAAHSDEVLSLLRHALRGGLRGRRAFPLPDTDL